MNTASVCMSNRLFVTGSKGLHKTLLRMSSILVYCGKGSNERSRNIFLHSLRETIDLTFHDVGFISADEVKEGSWMSQTKVICVGGGYDLGYIESLGTSGLRNIQEFVRTGGSYFGICAGAYLACDSIEFDMNGPLKVVGERSLKFYEGKCIGPALPGFDYFSRRGVHAVPIKYQNMEVQTYLEGGGYFIPHRQSSSLTLTEVLGQYRSLERAPAAIVKCQVGKGCAVLSGVHLEYPVKCLDYEDKYIEKVLPVFISDEEKRNFVFRNILSRHLGVLCCDEDQADR